MKHAVALGADVAVGMAAVVAVLAVVRAALAPRETSAALGSGLGLVLEFLLAAGLLRLATRLDLAHLGIAVFIIALRKVISAGLRYGQTAAG